MSEITDRLPRIKLNVKGPNPHQTLAKELRELVGYKALDRHVRENRLAFVLDFLDIQPYENVAVKEYMKKEIEKKRNMRGRPTGRRVSPKESYLSEMFEPRDIQDMIDRQFPNGTQVEVWAWKRYDIAKYDKAIPISALEKMVNVAKKATEINLAVTFHVHSLESRVLTADPFLSVRSTPTQEYYIAVWDEPTFVG